MGWGAGSFGPSSWGVFPGGRAGLTAFDVFFGGQQGRLDPTTLEPTEGTFAFVMGVDGTIPTHLTDIAVGDFIQIAQTADFDTNNIVQIDVKMRGPSALAAGTTGWKLSLLINSVERMSRTIGANQVLDTVFSANVSALAGDHELALRLELV